MKALFRYAKVGLKKLWTLINFIRQLIINLIFIGFALSLILILTLEFPTQKSTDKATSEPHALLINISGPIVEKRQPIDPFNLASRNLFAQAIQQENLLFDLVDQIRTAAKDNQINGIVLDLSEMLETNLTKLRYIAKALNEFKAEGKKVIAIGGYYSQSQYYLASFADKIYMAKDGAVLIQGYSSYQLYFKEFLDRFDVNTHVFRVGEYKSAVEPYTRSNMSPEARESNISWLSQLWKAYVDDVARNRKISPDNLTPDANKMVALMQQVNGDTALLAQQLGLVDELLTLQQMRIKLAEYFGSNGKDSTNYVSIYDYSIRPISSNENKIAVVVASGVIVDGADTEHQTGGDSTADLLRKARLNEQVKAVVLRIDSPGGSAFASEIIRNEVEALKKAGKPVIASMSSVAASGGYWIASSANKIVAQPTTLTGSIGIFGLITTFEKTLANYGIYNDGLGTTPLARIGLTRELPESAQKMMQLSVENGYHRFISLVSTQRGISLEKVKQIAEGRVWTGADAIENKLVDHIGDFDFAIDMAAELAKLSSYDLKWMQEPLTPAQEFFIEFFANAMLKLGFASKPTLPTPFDTLAADVMKEVKQLSSFNDPHGQYAVCSDCVTQ